MVVNLRSLPTRFDLAVVVVRYLHRQVLFERIPYPATEKITRRFESELHTSAFFTFSLYSQLLNNNLFAIKMIYFLYLRYCSTCDESITYNTIVQYNVGL